jgi:hypothetical protein
MKKILIALLIIGAAGAGIGFYLYNKPVASLENKKPDVEVSAGKMIADYETDEAAANAAYLGKVVQVSGTFSTLTEEGGKKKVHLDTGNPMSMIICELEDGAVTPKLSPGQEIRVKGLCSGYLSDVILVQANVMQ